MAIDPVTLSALFSAGKSALSSKKGKKVAKTGVLGALPFLGNKLGLFDKGEDASLQDQRTPQQLEAAGILQSLGTTGTGAGITLGEKFEGSLGDFESTDIEQAGLRRLLESTGARPDLSKARSTFESLADTTFDPDDPRTGFGAFKKLALRESQAGQDVLNREAAITGSRFGTGIQRRKRELGDITSERLQNRLADLFTQSRQTQLAGATGLAGLAAQEQGQERAGIEQALRLGGRERELKTQEARAKFNEFNRQRAETLGRIDLLRGEANRNPMLGISSIPGSPSPFSQLINSVLGSAGDEFGSRIGKKGLDYLASRRGGGGSNIGSGVTSYGVKAPSRTKF